MGSRRQLSLPGSNGIARKDAEEHTVLYYHFRIPLRKKSSESVAGVSQSSYINSRSAELNRMGPDNVWFYVVKVADSYLELCANIGYRCKDKPSEMAKAFSRALGFDAAAMATTKEITTEEFAHLISTAKQSGFIDDVGSVLMRSTVGSYKDCTSGRYREELVEGPLKKEEVYALMERYDLSDVLKEEIDRIFSAGRSDFIGHPVHYVVYSSGYSRKNEIIKVLITALYSAGRLRSKRFSLMDGEPTGSLMEILNADDDEKLFHLYQASGGATVVVYPLDCKMDYDESDSESFHNKLALLASDKNHEILTVLGFSQNERKVANAILSKMNGMRFVEINDRVTNADRIRSRLMEKAEADGIEDTESLLSMVDETAEEMTEIEADFAYAAWIDKRIIGRYPQYAGIEKVCSEIGVKIENDDAYAKLQSLIGLKNAKTVIDRILGYHKTSRLFKENGISGMNPSYHMVFTGAPGTAKTTVARLFAEIMKNNGILPIGDLVEVGRQNLVGQYVGWTAKAVENAFDRARGSVLFIDEAYSLCDGREGSFGDEAINTIVQLMENRREDTVVIFAGYPDRMNAFLDRNPGLRSRIMYHVAFDDYSVDELMLILEKLAAESCLRLNKESENKAKELFSVVKESRDFGNGRFVRNLFEQARINLAYRVSRMETDAVSKETLTTLIAEDFELPSAFRSEPRKRKMGF